MFYLTNEMKNILYYFGKDILENMIKYGEVSKFQANNIVTKMKKLDIDSAMSWYNLLRETPYYWAMQILNYKTNPLWHLDPNMWPEPEGAIHNSLRLLCDVDILNRISTYLEPIILQELKAD